MTFARPGFLAFHETAQEPVEGEPRTRTVQTGGITFRVYGLGDVTLSAADVKALGEYIAQ